MITDHMITAPDELSVSLISWPPSTHLEHFMARTVVSTRAACDANSKPPALSWLPFMNEKASARASAVLCVSGQRPRRSGSSELSK